MQLQEIYVYLRNVCIISKTDLTFLRKFENNAEFQLQDILESATDCSRNLSGFVGWQEVAQVCIL